MEIEFATDELRRLHQDPRCDGGFPPGIAKAYRKRVQTIHDAPDERVFYALKSLHFEKLKGTRDDQYSMRLNDQFRLIVKLIPSESRKQVRVVGVTDYH